MGKKIDSSIILLTYKGKVLLTMMRDSRQALLKQGTWSFIGGVKEKNESFEETITRKIKEEMNIEVNSIKFLLVSPSDDKSIYFYHGKLTDNNVNRIERAEGQELQFFNLKELDKLQLTTSTNLFFTQYRNLVEELLVN